ncbi:anti-sigma factor family protein [Streptomyces tsukubensis]|uniref:anti-sigma factor family protein n=1 Tax=Streptomyces tsukubensis TaxID=83656 RepID=UPI0036AB40F5
MTMRGQDSIHDAVGAYVLGVLDDADVSAFEAHLAGCDICAVHVEEFSGLEPMLAALADAPVPPAAASPLLRRVGAPAGASPPPRPLPVLPGPPGPRVLGGVLDEVAGQRAARRRRGRYLVAAAAALVVAVPVTTYAFIRDGDAPKGSVEAHPTSPAEDAFFHHMPEKVRATDPTTRVSATVGLEKKGWGTHAVLELKGVKGPLKCNLVAVSKTGEEEVITSWSVPRWGYGIPDGPSDASKAPLYVHGGAAMDREDIDRFEVRTFDNQKLVEIDA